MSPHLLSQCVTSHHNNTNDTHITIIVIIISVAYLRTIINILHVVSGWFLVDSDTVLIAAICSPLLLPTSAARVRNQNCEKIPPTTSAVCCSYLMLVSGVVSGYWCQIMQFYFWPLMFQFVCLVAEMRCEDEIMNWNVWCHVWHCNEIVTLQCPLSWHSATANCDPHKM